MIFWEMIGNTLGMHMDNYPYAPCMVYLPTKLGDFVRVNVGVHIPAPWSIWVMG